MKRKIRHHRGKVEDPYSRIHLLVEKHVWEWQSVGAIITLGGGLLSPLIGILLDLIGLLTRASYLRLPLTKISLAFYAAAFPLLALGSHCLDLLEKQSPALPPEDLKPHEFDLGLKA